jgi:DNA-binding FadR family transcriptional regulator
MFSKLSSKRSFEEVVAQIRAQIANGSLREGDRLPAERELAVQFGVSRNTVREALRSLENAGVVTLRKGVSGGAFICSRSGDAVMAALGDLFRLGAISPAHLTEARLILGTEIARLACVRRDDDDLHALAENVRMAQKVLDSGDLRSKAEMNIEFNKLLAAATKNPVLIVMTNALLDITREFVQSIGPMPNRFVQQAHLRILDHVRKRNADAAAKEMAAYLNRTQRTYLGKAGARTERAAAEAVE